VQSSMAEPFFPRIARHVPPAPSDPEAARRGRDRLEELLGGADPEVADRLRTALACPGAAELLDAVLGNSPFLSGCLLRAPAAFADMQIDGADRAFQRIMTALPKPDGALPSEQAGAILRQLRGQAALVIALADLSGQWDLDRIVRALSDFADAALDSALATALAAQSRRPAGKESPPDLEGCGYVLLAMGKLGAHELNYSSDVDLIALYDAARLAAWLEIPPEDAQRAAVRATQALTRLLQDRTRDGYVFRVDLRLRPDPGATQVALPVDAAISYYESYGQNWERAAMIKARPAAGDLRIGAYFLDEIVPFIWRRNMDFAAIADIMAVKRQIQSHKGHARVTAAGHDVKVGRGGIREIEFFAQTQQLIAGGREPALRHRRTLDSLAALAQMHRIDDRTCTELSAAYAHLRTTEHRLQMIDDQQTQKMPAQGAALDRFAIFLGYDSTAALEDDLTGVLRCVQGHFDALFRDPEPQSQGGNLVFTGTDHDPDTLETLAGMGFENPETVSRIVRDWHRARYPALRTRAARERLTTLMPDLLAAFGDAPNPDQAFKGFDEFLSRLPAGIQLFAMLLANRSLLGLLAEVMGGFPDLARHLSRYPILFDAMLDTDFYAPLPPAAALREELRSRRAHARHEEDSLRAACRWVRDRELQTGIQVLRGMAKIEQAMDWLTDIADSAVEAILSDVEAQHRRNHGQVDGGGFVVLAMGRLGAREMLVGSDLDLVFLYDHPEGAEASDGPKPLSPPNYFARLGQRLIAAMTAMTPDGRLFEVDMRLRPSGKSGPVATSLDAFRKYYREDAQTWELMALTKARAVCGSPALVETVLSGIRALLSMPRDADTVRRDAAAMRIRMRETYPGTQEWDMKHGAGGLVDTDFIWQSLALIHAGAVGGLPPPAAVPPARTVMEKLCGAGILAPDDRSALEAVRHLANTVLMAQRLAAGRSGTTNVNLAQFQVTLSRAARRDDFAALHADLEAGRAAVREVYARLLPESAAVDEPGKAG